MKILLLGEYSNLHWTLAQGLRYLQHDVTVVSAGDSFKNYKRDINLSRKGYGVVGSVRYLYDVAKCFWQFRGYDIVQIISPFFLDLKADKNLEAFKYLKKHNGKVFMGAFGDDTYWLRAALDKNKFRYSEFNIPNRLGDLEAMQQLIRTWSDKDKIRVNKQIAEQADGIIACLYEYYVAYKGDFSSKLSYIPEPINTSEIQFKQRGLFPDKVSFFIGIQKLRSQIKGTDILYKVLQEVKCKYTSECEVIKAESMPYHQYVLMMDKSDVLLDQIYSYSPAMNALYAMGQGLVVVSGGEPEIYSLLGEMENKPIVNVIPTEEDIFRKLESLIQNRGEIPKLSIDSYSFIKKHHDYIKVANQYLDVWNNV